MPKGGQKEKKLSGFGAYIFGIPRAIKFKIGFLMVATNLYLLCAEVQIRRLKFNTI